MNKIFLQTGRNILSVTVVFMLFTGHMPSQPTTAISSKQAGKLLDFNGDGREDLINVQQLPGKLSIDGLSFNGKNFSISTLTSTQSGYGKWPGLYQRNLRLSFSSAPV